MADINLGVGGANSAVAEGYTIDNSFVQEYNSTRRVSMYYGGFGGSAPTNTKATISFWFKLAALNGGAANWKLLDTQNSQFGVMPEGGTYDSSIYCAGQNESLFKLVSTAKFRDTSAWYHMCVVCDSTLSTASDRVKVYINGVRITDWSTANYPSQNADLLLVKENTTFSAPSNATEGAIISVEIAQGGTAYTVAWNTVFEFAASTAPTVTATANKTDIFAFRYNGSVWQEIGRVQNLAQT